jgi:hypothetical protein
MEKDAYYFPHFCNARHDRKIKRVIKELGVEGYGIFFMLLEVLRDQTDFKFPMEDMDLLADEFGTSEQKVRVVICNYQLFEFDDEKKFFSPKMLMYLQPYFSMKEQRRIAGIASGIKRKELANGRSTDGERNRTKESKVKESKEKESKVKESKEKESKFIPPTSDEIESFATEKGYKLDGNKILNHYDYDRTGVWIKSNNKPVLNWKQTLENNWFKDEYKLQTTKPTMTQEDIERIQMEQYHQYKGSI